MSRHPHFKPRALVVALAAAFSSVQAAPNGGQVVSGSAVISQPAANLLQVNASTGKTIINWQQFSIAKGESVQMNLPSASSAILNRVTGGDPSQILGSLQSNGRVFLINPNGVVFGAGASIDTAGFIASTLGMSDADFLADRLCFSGSGGDISNQANMVVKGNLALIAPSLTNNGTIRVENGNLLLAAGQTVELVDLATPELRYQLSAPDNAVLNLGTLDVVNGAASLFAGNIRHAGQLQATRAELGDGGKIVLRADNITVDAGATINADAKAQGNGGNIELIAKQTAAVHGSLSARGGSESGNGGFIETSGQQVQLEGINVDTRAANGNTGNWLIDPNDFVVAASGGDITGAALSGQLAQNNITLSSASGANAGNGDVLVNDQVSWSADTTLTLQAERHVAINQQVSATGNAAGVVITPGTGGQLQIGQDGKLDITGSNASLTIAGNAYQLIRTQAELTSKLAASGGAAGTGRYALGADFSLDAAFATRQGLASGAVLEGLGHTVTGQKVALLNSNAGRISNLDLAAVNLNLTGINVGALANSTTATSAIDHVGVSGSVKGGSSVGALVGRNLGAIQSTNSSATVTGGTNTGGLVGENTGSSAVISNSSAGGAVSSTSSNVGGLVGYSYNGAGITASSASGAVSGTGNVGGLVGENYNASISGSQASGKVTSSNSNAGGLVGYNYGYGGTASIDGSTATGEVVGASYVGGLVGDNDGTGGSSAIISNSQASGKVTASGSYVGGLVGRNVHWSGGSGITAISNSSASNSVTGSNYVGGLVGYQIGDTASLSNSAFTGSVTATTNPLNGQVWLGGTLGYLAGGSFSNNFYNVDTVTLNGQRVFTRGALYGDQFANWQNNGRNLDINSQFTLDGNGRYQIGTLQDWRNLLAYADSNKQFVLTGDLDLSGDTGYSLAYFAANLDGAGHTISNLSLSNSGFTHNWGLFGTVTSAGSVSNLNLANAQVSGHGNTGLLVGQNAGTLSNVSASGTARVAGNSSYSNTGGLVGSNSGSISGSASHGSVAGYQNTGGLVGYNTKLIDGSQSDATVTATSSNAGGLVGENTGSSAVIRNSSASGSVSAVDDVGGLVGQNSNATIENSFASGVVRGSGTTFGSAGGLVGYNYAGSYQSQGAIIRNSYATGDVFGADAAGGLVGENFSGSRSLPALIEGSYATGRVTGVSGVGGLVGINYAHMGTARISNSYATGDVKASGYYAGGLVGYNEVYSPATDTTVEGSFASNKVSGTKYVGGLVGLNEAIIRNSYAGGSVAGTDFVGGLVGSNGFDGWDQNAGATISNSYAYSVVATGSTRTGGLVGYNTGVVTGSYWNIEISGQSTSGAGVGLTTSQMKSAANFSGWDFSTSGSWRVLEGSSMPYLAWQYSSAPVVVEGAVSGSAGQRVGFAANGVDKGVGYSGANNRYYMLLPDSNGSVWMAYTGQSAAIYQNKADIDFTQLNLGSNLVAMYGPSLNNSLLTQAVGQLAAPLTQQNGALVLAAGSSLQQSGGEFTLTSNITGGAGQSWQGKVVVDGEATLSSQSGTVDFAGDVQVGNGSSLTLGSSGSGGGFAVMNGGTLQTAGNRSLSALDNDGLLRVVSGELSLNGGGVQYGQFASDGSLRFASGNWSLQDGVLLSGMGSFAKAAAANVTVDGLGSGVTVASGATVDLSALALGGAGKLTNLGTLTGTGSTIGFTLDNQGSATFSGTTVQAALSNQGSLTLQAGSTAQSIDNQGSLLLGNSQVSTLSNRLAGEVTLNQAVIGELDNTGALTVSGTSRVTNTRQQDGMLTVSAGQSLVTDAGTFSWGGGKIVSSPGGLSFVNGGRFVFSGSGNRVIDGLNLAFDNLTMPDGSLTLKSGSLTLTGSSTLRAGTSLALQGGQFINNSTLSVGGSFALTGGSYEGSGGLTMQSGGVLQRPANSTVSWQNNGAMVNQGTLDIAGGTVTSALTNTGTMNIGSGTTFNQLFTNTGTLNLGGNATFQGGLSQQGGVVQLGTSGNAASITASSFTLNGGVLKGSGTINGNVVSNGGTLAVGYSPGSLVINGDLTLNAASVLNMELGGVGVGAYDSIVVNGQANLAGTLNVVPWGGFSPASAFNLSLLQYQSKSGNFAAINVPTSNYQSTLGGTGLTLAWSSSPVVPPVTPTIPAVPPIALAPETVMAQADMTLDDYQQLAKSASKAQDWAVAGILSEPESGDGRKELEVCP